ncbi:LPXTG cell wall anchor domain-containing protein [Candidatus Bipolaricaulota bacterium]|nr:LPXTG cell wall anchor domain-containing protein [Candidatus Bipolaricaulota bacterium]
MKTVRFYIYSVLLGIGAALVGLVIGFLIDTPSTAVASILIVIGLFFVAGAILLARRFKKHIINE